MDHLEIGELINSLCQRFTQERGISDKSSLYRYSLKIEEFLEYALERKLYEVGGLCNITAKVEQTALGLYFISVEYHLLMEGRKKSDESHFYVYPLVFADDAINVFYTSLNRLAKEIHPRISVLRETHDPLDQRRKVTNHDTQSVLVPIVNIPKSIYSPRTIEALQKAFDEFGNANSIEVIAEFTDNGHDPSPEDEARLAKFREKFARASQRTPEQEASLKAYVRDRWIPKIGSFREDESMGLKTKQWKEWLAVNS